MSLKAGDFRVHSILRLLATTLLVTSVTAWGKIVISGVTGVSNFVNSATAPGIYGGISPVCTSAFTACNPAPIDANTTITFTLTSDTQNTGKAAIVASSTTSTLSYISSSITARGQSATLQIPWGQLCGIISGNSACTNEFSVSVSLGFSTTGNDGTFNTNDDRVTLNVAVLDATGFDTTVDCSEVGSLCQFWSYPADEGIYLKILDSHSSFPSLSTGKVTAIKVYVSSQGWDKANPVDRDKEETLTLDANGKYNEYIGGLNNGTPYYFRIASQDIAGNVFNFTDDMNILDTAYGNCPSASAVPNTPPALNLADENTDIYCLYRAYPDRVSGILAKDLNCFIATASYGSSLEPKLQTFRDFRFNFLLSNKYGRKFVESYYQWGPYVAQWIYNNEWARPITRAGLWPLWAFAALSLKFGLMQVSLMMLAGIAALIITARKLRNVLAP